MSAAGDSVVAEASSGVGQAEVNGLCPPYTNSIGRQAWCGAFVEYCYRTAIGVPLKKYTSNPFYVSTCWADMKKRGFSLNISQSAPGDIVFFNWDGGREDHMGIVEKNLGGGTLQTIEGNSGNMVKRQNRSGNTLVGVARIPEIQNGGGIGGPSDPAPPPSIPAPVGMDYGLNITMADNTRIYEGGLQYCAHDSVVGWNTSSMGRGAAADKIQVWTQRGNYCLDLVTVVWDFSGKANPD